MRKSNHQHINDKFIHDNKDLIRIIGTALYPARKQWELLQEAKEEMKNMKFTGRKSYALKVQKKAIEWEKSLLNKKYLR